MRSPAPLYKQPRMDGALAPAWTGPVHGATDQTRDKLQPSQWPGGSEHTVCRENHETPVNPTSLPPPRKPFLCSLLSPTGTGAPKPDIRLKLQCGHRQGGGCFGNLSSFHNYNNSRHLVVLHCPKSEHLSLAVTWWRYRKLRPERLGDFSKVTQQAVEKGFESRQSDSTAPRDYYLRVVGGGDTA